MQVQGKSAGYSDNIKERYAITPDASYSIVVIVYKKNYRKLHFDSVEVHLFKEDWRGL